MTHWVYLISIAVLTVPLIIDEWIIGQRKLRPYWRLLAILAIGGLAYAVTERWALGWSIWSFDTRTNLDAYLLGAHIETYVVNALVFPIIGAATLLLVGAHHRIRRPTARPNSSRRPYRRPAARPGQTPAP